MSVTQLRQAGIEAHERHLRIDLAAAFRLAALNDWHEAVANHFSVAVSDEGQRFLMNPRWMHFQRIRASDLLLLDTRDPATMSGVQAPDPSAWCIHSRLHALLPQARCVLHVHSPYATALAALADPEILPIDQNTARYFRRVAIDRHYGGIADHEAEGERLARVMGEQRRMILGNHGVIVAAPTVAAAFDDLYYLERSCRTLMLAYASGRPLAVLSDAVAEATARGWEAYEAAADVHFREARTLLDRRGEDYAD